jgi:error-prone DNA polymerase
LVRGLSREVADALVLSRGERPFTGLDDFVDRVSLARDDLERLAEAGAFEGLMGCRREALWRTRAPRVNGLFEKQRIEPDEPVGLKPVSRREQLTLDYDTTGISLHDHPMRHLRAALAKRRVRVARDQSRWRQGEKVVVAGVVLTRQRPSTAKGIVFITLEDETGTINLVLYSDLFERYELIARHAGMLLARGTIDRRGDVVHVRVRHLERLDLPPRPDAAHGLRIRSRDFH